MTIVALQATASVRQQKMPFVNYAQTFGRAIALGMTLRRMVTLTVATQNRAPSIITAPLVVRAKAVVLRALLTAKLDNTRRAVAIQIMTMVVVQKTHSASIVRWTISRKYRPV